MVRLNPSHVKAQFNLWLEWARVPHWESAATALRDAASLMPNDPDVPIS